MTIKYKGVFFTKSSKLMKTLGFLLFSKINKLQKNIVWDLSEDIFFLVHALVHILAY